MRWLAILAAVIAVVFLVSRGDVDAPAPATAPAASPATTAAPARDIRHPARVAPPVQARADVHMAPRPEGGRPDRDARWATRMERVHERARAELGASDDQAAQLLTLQTDLRTFKEQVHHGLADGRLSKAEGDQLLARRVERFQGDVADVVGADHVDAYFQIVKEVRLAQGSD